jgi:TetR/AcrR family transcriptional regulator of autoinduction and epiphytic fitness
MAATTSTADGRAARAARTRETVVEALLALIDEGNPRPTAREIADRAGVSLRSVYVHFDDLEDLFTAAAAQQYQRMSSFLKPLPIEGPLADRIGAFVKQRCELMEAGARVRHAALLQEPFSPTLAKVLRVVRKAARDEVQRVFAPELDRHSGGARDRLVAAVDVVSNGAAWEALREHHGLAFDDAALVITDTLTKLLDPGRGPSSRAGT